MKELGQIYTLEANDAFNSKSFFDHFNPFQVAS